MGGQEKNKKKIEQLKDMEIHEVRNYPSTGVEGSTITVIRVPNGWMYSYNNADGSNNSGFVFIPLD